MFLFVKFGRKLYNKNLSENFSSEEDFHEIGTWTTKYPPASTGMGKIRCCKKPENTWLVINKNLFSADFNYSDPAGALVF
jgi:hypothetical protein